MRRWVLALAVLSGCGELVMLEPPTPSGRACTSDAECVPDGCCGEATTAIHAMDARSCSGVTCSATCPASQVKCGCGVPVCRDARCAVAVDPLCG